MDDELADRLAIRDVIETWANARDSRDWEAFRACWHEDGYMMATWFRAWPGPRWNGCTSAEPPGWPASP